jgi:hypothetical protein
VHLQSRASRTEALTRCLALLFLLALPLLAEAETVQGVVSDETGAVVPGATIALCKGSSLVATTTSGPDGSFSIEGDGDSVVVSLSGFQPVTLPLESAARVVLRVAASSVAVEVTSSERTGGVTAGAAFTGEMDRAAMQRLPAVSQNVRASLPLLPGVLRGPDGLLRVNGARPHEAPLLLDGFDVTNPATGVSALDPPLESVQGTQVLRDPMDVTLGGFIGGAVAVDSRSGEGKPQFGVEGFVPRPRLGSGGFGSIEGFSPRVHLGGSALGGGLRYFAAGEYDYDRIAVPGVSERASDPNLVARGGTVITRVDLLGATRSTSLEAFVFPMKTSDLGLSPLRTAAASPTLDKTERFVGIAHQQAIGEADTVSLRVGVADHASGLTPAGVGPALVSPDGWRGNSFSTSSTEATRLSATAAWRRHSGPWQLETFGEATVGRLSGQVAEAPVEVQDAAGRLVREVDFGGASSLVVKERTLAAGASLSWRPAGRLEIEGGTRVDWSSLAGSEPSGRIGLRYKLDADGRTVVKIGAGRFVGRLPLAVPAFGDYPLRSDRSFDPASGDVISAATLVPRVGELRLPSAYALTAELERRVSRSLDVVLRATDRRSSHLPTLNVPGANGALSDGALVAASDGTARYWELQATGRFRWGSENQLFVSYVRSSARGELNDFGTLFHDADPALLQPGGVARLSADAPQRWLAWGTVSLPWQFVISPAFEWHSGFPYSQLDVRQFYAGPPQTSSFPAFLSFDAAISKKVVIKSHRVRLEVQLFGLTRHFNPRDVYAVAGSTRYGSFSNSVGLVTRGDIGIDW